ncbi:virion structural protein [Pseudomonas phage Noxifer]|uniref:Uncharacterized protein n=1 Tax=Pseudomonas phage Noxifer TaxID=2006684 RepID=A0A1Y0SV21_9CAUD|nr:virion structural protein [Pseudomonas phage Noxifer]ARV77361.1 hypothetical protein NOXIFER_192 [Pseudomonas phage Noxifer]
MQMVRDPDFIKKHLHEQNDGSVLTDTACRILVPERYASVHLANIGTEIHILGFYGILMGNRYGVVRTIAMFRIVPSSTEKVVINGVTYFDFHFEPGDTLIAGTEPVKNDTLSYYVYSEHVDKGNIPWYFNYIDKANLFETAEEFAGIYLGNRSILSLIISTTCRDPKDMTRLYRHIYEKHSDVETNPPVSIPFRNVIWNTSDTTSKFIGAYTADSIVSALVNPSDRVERIEELLRT